MAATTLESWTRRFEDLDTGPVPLRPYIDPEYFELERERIFRTVWLNVGRVEEIPSPGDYVVRDLAILKTSIIIARDKNRSIHAFHNMCSHRGNKVVIDSCGSAKGGFTCFFHGWTYDLSGALRGVTDPGAFFELRKSELGLTRVAVDTWEGFIFINVNPKPAQSLMDFLGSYAQAMAGYPFDRSSACYSWRAEVNVNWKIAKDAFAEAYHVKALHRRSVARSLSSGENPYVRALSFDVYGPHQSMSVPGNPVAPSSPVPQAAAKFGASMKRYEMATNWDGFPRGVNPTRSSNWIFELTTVFPNMNIHFFRNNFTTYTFWPLAVDRTVWEVKQYYAPATDAGSAFAQEVNKVMFRDTVLEDLGTLERTQSVLNSGAKSHFILSDEEMLIRRFNKIVDDYIAGH